MVSAHDRQDFALAFLSILFEGAPFILLGTLISGLVDIYLPKQTMDRFLPKNRFAAVAASGLLGAVFPVCECAVVPVIRRLVGKGLPVSCALTYMLAAPIVNPITALSTWKAFQNQGEVLMTSSRLLLGFLLATTVGLITLRLAHASILKPSLAAKLPQPIPPPHTQCACHPTGHPHAQGANPCQEAHDPAHSHAHGHDHPHPDDHGAGTACCGHDHAAPASGDARLIAAMRSALKDFIEVGVYFTIGVAITALFNTGIAPGAQWLDGLAQNPTAAPAALMALAFILSLCSTSDAFIAATLAKFTWSAKLAFLTFGPMMDVKLLFLYQSVLNRRFILWLALGLFLAIGAISIALQFLIDPRLLT